MHADAAEVLEAVCAGDELLAELRLDGGKDRADERAQALILHEGKQADHLRGRLAEDGVRNVARQLAQAAVDRVDELLAVRRVAVDMQLAQLEDDDAAADVQIDALNLGAAHEVRLGDVDLRENPVVKEAVADPVRDLFLFVRVVLRELNLRHPLDDLAVAVDLLAVARDADGADGLPVDIQRVVAAAQRALVFAILMDEELAEPLAQQLCRAAVVIADAAGRRAGDDGAILVKEVELLLQNAGEAVDDVLGKRC